jgi:hypothetical protein
MMATDTKTDRTSAAQEAAGKAKQFAEAQEQAARQWTRTQEEAIGVLREAQTTFLGAFPTPFEVVEAGYDLAAQALAIQKGFATRWVEWVTPQVADKRNR